MLILFDLDDTLLDHTYAFDTVFGSTVRSSD
jgi:FMN phosphatase YigB (HAD superfamily)